MGFVLVNMVTKPLNVLMVPLAKDPIMTAINVNGWEECNEQLCFGRSKRYDRTRPTIP